MSCVFLLRALSPVVGRKKRSGKVGSEADAQVRSLGGYVVQWYCRGREVQVGAVARTRGDNMKTFTLLISYLTLVSC